jgi:diguanylate cyclase (GGDEF)-like protein
VRLVRDARSSLTEQVKAAELLAATDRATALSGAIRDAQARIRVSAGYDVVRLAVEAGQREVLQAALSQTAMSPAVTAGAVTDGTGAVLASTGPSDSFDSFDGSAGVSFRGDGGDATISMPIRDGEGPPVGWLHQAFALGRLVPALQERIPYFTGATSVATRRGTVIMTTAPGAVGRVEAPELLQLLARGRSASGTYESPMLGKRVAAVAPVRGTDLMVVVGADYSAVAGPAGDLAWQILLNLGLTALVIGGLVALLTSLARRSRRRLVADRRLATTLAETDGLTGLANRRAFDQEVQAADARGGFTAVVMIDLDYLKAINDNHGHGVGDRALQMTAAALRASVRPGDFVARIGGDEFAMLLPATDQAQADVIAARVRTAAAAMSIDDYGPLRLSTGVEVGVAGAISTAVRGADAKLYEAKARRD